MGECKFTANREQLMKLKSIEECEPTGYVIYLMAMDMKAITGMTKELSTHIVTTNEYISPSYQ
jgi:hypothetical protein